MKFDNNKDGVLNNKEFSRFFRHLLLEITKLKKAFDASVLS